MSKFLKGIKGNLPELKTQTEVSAQDIDALTEKLHAPDPIVETPKAVKTPRPKVAKVAKPRTVRTASEADAPKDLHRLTLDLPTELMEKVKLQTKNNGQTVKGFMMTLIIKYFENTEK